MGAGGAVPFLAELLAAFPPALAAELRAWPAPLLRWRPEREAWCALEVVGHLIEADERGFVSRLRVILATPSGAAEPTFATWDPAAVARARRDDERDPADLLAEFAARRADGATLAARLTPADLARGGRHPDVGRLTIGELLHEWVHHDREHHKQIATIAQDAVWRGMGAAQRFGRRRSRS